MANQKFPWKQNLFKVPNGIKNKVESFGNRQFIVAAVKKIPQSDVEHGLYEHLGISLDEDGIVIPDPQSPPATIGRWSRINLEGKEVVRKDLPKYWKTFSYQAPSWRGYSTHTVYQDREVYPRDYIRAKTLDIEITLLEEIQENSQQYYILRFLVVEPLSSNQQDVEAELLYNLNMLQENTGCSDVFLLEAPAAEYLATVHINWEILPPGERDENIRRIMSGTKTGHSEREVRQRYMALENLNPAQIVKGSSGFSRYFGAVFEDDLVAFENLKYGNALYLMYQDWRELSQRSRLELLAGDRDGFERIIHNTGWERKLRQLVRSHREQQKI